MSRFKYAHAHLIGIGGIGMSALAQMLVHHGVSVTGSDREESPVIAMLMKKGINVLIGQKEENVPEGADVVVYSDAVPENNPERARARALGILERSYFSMLGEISKGKRTIAIAGTHGKTTTTGMLAKILIDAGAQPSVIVGSLMKDFGSNFVSGTSDLFVVEACEYRNHLLELSPEILVITNLEWDHTDWFHSLEDVQEIFCKAVASVPAHGVIVTNPQDKNIAPVLAVAQAKVMDYTQESFYELQLLGAFNQMNARAAVSATRAILGTVPEDTSTSLSSFSGTWRRFEHKGKTKNGANVYDDYAHHPTAIRETLSALRQKTRGKIFAVFQPHLYSRTKALFSDFASAFKDSDEVLFAPIYAAREEKDDTVSSELLAKATCENGTNAQSSSFAEIKLFIQAKATEDDSVITMGAGDIYKVADAIVDDK